MNKMLNLILKAIALVVFIISAIWWYKSPGYDSVIAALTSLSAFIALFFISDSDDKGNKMNQRSGNNSTLYQSSGPMNIR